MNLLTSGSRSETLESETHPSQHQSIISQFKQTHSEDYHQNQLQQLPPLSSQRYYYSSIQSSSLYSSEPNSDSSPTLLLPLLFGSNPGGGIIFDVIVSKNGKFCLNSSYYGAIDQVRWGVFDLMTTRRMIELSSSSKKSKSKPVRLTKLFDLLMEDDEEEQQQEGKWFMEEVAHWIINTS
ncbi:hypothetical protein BY996DRAFT_6474034 [Phakopsora pachyrhizi]|nr:hypothetical protein BY996DRAFT_6474034 [Phakopsora pachyrhizi]